MANGALDAAAAAALARALSQSVPASHPVLGTPLTDGEVARAIASLRTTRSDMSLNELLDQIVRDRFSRSQIARNASRLTPHFEYDSSCGYCPGGKTDDTSFLFGADAKQLTVADYEELISRGWRRSGTWLYKPSNAKTCCPQYAIRFAVDEFVPTRKQRAALNRLGRFITTGDPRGADQKKDKGRGSSENSAAAAAVAVSRTAGVSATSVESHDSSGFSEYEQDIGSTLTRVISAAFSAPAVDRPVWLDLDLLRSPTDLADAVFATLRKIISEQQRQRGAGALYSSTIAPFLAGLSLKSDRAAGIDAKNAVDDHEPAAKSARTKRDKPPHASATKAEQLARAISEQWRADVVEDGSAARHFDAIPSQRGGILNFVPKISVVSSSTGPVRESSNFVVAAQPQPQPNAHEVSVEILSSEFRQEEYSVFKRYQESVHKDKPDKNSPDSYTRFLCTSPLIPEQGAAAQRQPDKFVAGIGVPTFPGFGTFHMVYRVDGKIMAVSVIDVLPHCVSSVYLFYDPDFEKLSPGVVTVLFEVECVHEWKRSVPDLTHYWLGYYVHSCPKMLYKGAYGPSELLNPVSLRWVPLNDALRHRLDERKFFDFENPDAANVVENSSSVAGVDIEDPDLLESFLSSLVYVLPADDADSSEEEDGAEHSFRLVSWSLLNPRALGMLRPRMKEWVRRAGKNLALRTTIALQ